MEQSNLIILLLGIITLTLLVNLWTWYGDINRRKRHMEAQTKLLAQIAASNGVDKDKIAEIVAEAVI
jgi:alkylhydroperoxidase/carboxymuconolactone decarboxylase family protein YurZ